MGTTVKAGLGRLIVGWLAWFAFGAALLSGACGTSPAPMGGNVAGTGSSDVATTGVCADTCPTTCARDQDCNVGNHETCCDVGDPSVAKFCAAFGSCPKVCSTDAMCDTALGEACARFSLRSPLELCSGGDRPPAPPLKSCAGAADCLTSEICCDVYSAPICLPPAKCPKACTGNVDCPSTDQICCTTASLAAPDLRVTGVCLDAFSSPTCPTACASSIDCRNTPGQSVCCHGLCAQSCPDACRSDSDCNANSTPGGGSVAQVCCKSSPKLPAQTVIVSGPTRCIGTPGPCSSCDTLLCGTPQCPGCAPVASCTGVPPLRNCSECTPCSSCIGCMTQTAPGSCTGTPAACSICDLSGGCLACPAGCTPPPAGGGICRDTIASGNCSRFYSYGNCTGAGCSWDGISCSGTPTPCASFTTKNTCTAASCAWSTPCTGTPTSCSQYTTDSACRWGCTWNAAVQSCVGTITPCAQLTTNTCSTQPGCIVANTGCNGTPTPCEMRPALSCSTGCTTN